MPTSWVLQVLEERLAAEDHPIDARVSTKDLLELSDTERDAALDVLATGHGELPVVLVDGTVVCSGSFDVDAIMSEVCEARSAAARRIAEQTAEDGRAT